MFSIPMELMEERVPLYFMLGMPTSWPAVLNMPPPLLPLLMAASVWIILFFALTLRP